MRERDNFDCNNLGGFRRSYPNPNCVSNSILSQANDLTVVSSVRIYKRNTIFCSRNRRPCGTSLPMVSRLMTRTHPSTTIISPALHHLPLRRIRSETTKRRRWIWEAHCQNSSQHSSIVPTINTTRTG